jgi:hypothetical protein
MPNIASESMTRVCVRNRHITRVGGILALADFHDTPPFGKSIVGEVSCARRRSMLSCEERIAMVFGCSSCAADDYPVGGKLVAVVDCALFDKERGERAVKAIDWLVR